MKNLLFSLWQAAFLLTVCKFGYRLEDVNHCFSKQTVEDILEALVSRLCSKMHTICILSSMCKDVHMHISYNPSARRISSTWCSAPKFSFFTLLKTFLNPGGMRYFIEY